MDLPVELRQLRYFVAVAEELHFGRAAERLHMSQSPLSRAIRELERELGLVLFVRTTRRVELTPAGTALLERARRALAEIDAAVDEARRAAEPDGGVLGVGYTPFTRLQATRIAEELERQRPELELRLEEDVTPELLRQVAGHELAAAAVMETPAAARRHGVRIDALRDEPLLAALPATHDYANADAIPVGAFAAELVLLPREPPGRRVQRLARCSRQGGRLRARAHAEDAQRPVGSTHAAGRGRRGGLRRGRRVGARADRGRRGRAVRSAAELPDRSCVGLRPTAGSSWSSAARGLRDAEGWLTHRAARTELPSD